MRRALGVREDEEMRHAQRAGDVDEILEVVPFLLLEIQGGVGEHDLAEILLEMAERGGQLAAGEDEALGDLVASDLVHVRHRCLLLPRHRRRHLPLAFALALATAAATAAAATVLVVDSRHG